MTSLVIEYDIDEIEMTGYESYQLELYRILQECVINVCKHAHAQNMKVFLKDFLDHIELTVEDDGVGFDLEEAKNKENHFGLFILKERVKILSGSMKIDTKPEKGTKIFILLQKL